MESSGAWFRWVSLNSSIWQVSQCHTTTVRTKASYLSFSERSRRYWSHSFFCSRWSWCQDFTSLKTTKSFRDQMESMWSGTTSRFSGSHCQVLCWRCHGCGSCWPCSWTAWSCTQSCIGLRGDTRRSLWRVLMLSWYSLRFAYSLATLTSTFLCSVGRQAPNGSNLPSICLLLSSRFTTSFSSLISLRMLCCLSWSGSLLVLDWTTSKMVQIQTRFMDLWLSWTTISFSWSKGWLITSTWRSNLLKEIRFLWVWWRQSACSCSTPLCPWPPQTIAISGNLGESTSTPYTPPSAWCASIPSALGSGFTLTSG